MGFGAIERQNQKNAVVKPLCRLMQLESSEIEISALLVEFTAGNELRRVGKPVLEMSFRLRACLLWFKRFRRCKGITL